METPIIAPSTTSRPREVPADDRVGGGRAGQQGGRGDERPDAEAVRDADGEVVRVSNARAKFRSVGCSGQGTTLHIVATSRKDAATIH